MPVIARCRIPVFGINGAGILQRLRAASIPFLNGGVHLHQRVLHFRALIRGQCPGAAVMHGRCPGLKKAIDRFDPLSGVPMMSFRLRSSLLFNAVDFRFGFP